MTGRFTFSTLLKASMALKAETASRPHARTVATRIKEKCIVMNGDVWVLGRIEDFGTQGSRLIFIPDKLGCTFPWHCLVSRDIYSI